jgi:hypothetical protein
MLTRATSSSPLSLGLAVLLLWSWPLGAAADDTRFYVVRHAEPVRPFQTSPPCPLGCSREPLRLAGMRRAEALRAFFRGNGIIVEAIYSTDTRRTWQTATPTAIAANVDVRLYDQPGPVWAARLRQEHAGDHVLIVGTAVPYRASSGRYRGKR